MRLARLSAADRALLERTRVLLEKRKSDVSGVSAGLRTSKGTEFYGLCIDAPTATVGMCAEFAAIGTMVTRGERSIETIVAVAFRGDGRYAVIPPCGKCRDFVSSFGDPYVMVQTGGSMTQSKKARLSELMPFPWKTIPTAT